MSMLASLNVLLVEDSGSQLHYLHALCQSLGVRSVLAARGGQEALQLARAAADKLQVAICDLDMPQMDGVELIRLLAEERLVTHLIVLSALDYSLLNTVAAMAQMRGLVVLGAIAKPISSNKLVDLLSRYRPQSGERSGDVAGVVPPFNLEELQHAIAGCALSVFFQPQASVADRSVYGAEALVRWKHPLHGMVQPQDFLPMAERHGLLDMLTVVMFGKAFAECSKWLRRGLYLRVSVNVAAQSLAKADFADIVADMAARHEVPPSMVMLEVTESAMLSNLSQSLETMARLRLKGFHLAVDDFGTGFSSLQQLSQIPLSELKIDRSIIHGAARRPQLAAILHSAIDMGRRLRVTTVAEGVENAEDWQMLRFSGCDSAQGYFLAKPMPADNMQRWLERNGRAPVQ
ncbi:MAG: EAL domain-containing response regulator [Chitinivorax sp.]